MLFTTPFCFLSGVLMLNGRYTSILSITTTRVGGFPIPIPLLIFPVHRMNNFLSISFKCLLPYAIGFRIPSSCFCHRVIPSPVLVASVVTMLSLTLRGGLDLGLRLTFVLSGPNQLFVPISFPGSILFQYFAQSVCLFR